jgi:peptidoglycan/LPS O-acetylase OafA/YrhL
VHLQNAVDWRFAISRGAPLCSKSVSFDTFPRASVRPIAAFTFARAVWFALIIPALGDSGNDGYNRPAMFTRDPGHLDHLDALRGIAVLGVVLVHSYAWWGHPLVLRGSVASVALSGQRGVQLFFIISAFTLFLSHDQRKGESAPLRNFFIRRICRIAPMFWLAALLSYLWLRPWFGTPAQFLPSLFLVQGFLPYSIAYGPAGGWSVGTEVCFYLSLPLLLHWIRRPRDIVIALTISLPVMYLLGRGLARFDHTGLSYYTFSGYLVNLPVFLMGMAAYFLYKRGVRGDRFISALLITLTCTLYFALLPFHYSTLYAESAVGALLLVALTLHPWKMLVNPLTRFLGKISYSIYLLHFCVTRAIQVLLDQHRSGLLSYGTARLLVCYLLTLLFTVPLAYATWQWVEEPGIRAGKRVIVGLDRKKALAACQ